MPHSPFRFIHASDFHLEQPLSGLAEVPEHLRDLYIDAPYLAAEKVFQAAVLEGAAFVILAGDLLQPLLAGPRGILFLEEQFAKLDEKRIEVYWAGGEIDPPESWPASLALPGNVHVFPQGRVDEYLIQNDGVPVARIIGSSRDSQNELRSGEFRPDATGLFTIAVAPSEATSGMSARGIHYWALGGRHQRNSPTGRDRLGTISSRDLTDSNANRGVLALDGILHYCGSPQGRHPSESDVHGCTLVQVDEQNQVRTSLIPCDAVRWLDEFITVEENTTREALETLLHERMKILRNSSPTVNLLVTWTLTGKGPLMHELHRGRLAVELLDGLRVEFGFNPPVAWSVALKTEPADSIPLDWYDQESIRGDFLRAIEHLRMNPADALEIEEYLCESHRAGTLSSAAIIEDDVMRRSVLREAAALGVELLGGEA